MRANRRAAAPSACAACSERREGQRVAPGQLRLGSQGPVLCQTRRLRGRLLAAAVAATPLARPLSVCTAPTPIAPSHQGSGDAGAASERPPAAWPLSPPRPLPWSNVPEAEPRSRPDARRSRRALRKAPWEPPADSFFCGGVPRTVQRVSRNVRRRPTRCWGAEGWETGGGSAATKKTSRRTNDLSARRPFGPGAWVPAGGPCRLGAPSAWDRSYNSPSDP